MTERPLDAWAADLPNRRVHLPNSALEDGLSYLEGARHAKGWGILPGSEFDRRASALAMDALWTVGKNSDDDHAVANLTLVFEKKYRDQIRGLRIEAFADVVTLLRSSVMERAELRQAVERRAVELIRGAASEMPIDGPRHLAALLLALASCEIELDTAQRQQIVALFTDQQDRREGSWSIRHGKPGTLVATAEVLRAMPLLGESVSEHWGLGLRWFNGIVSTLAASPTDVETYDLAIALRTLAGVPDVDYELVLALQDELTRRQDDECGGWPSQPGRDATVEPTALAVLALTAAGAHDHVPFNLAEAILDAARRKVAEVSGERNDLRENADGEVKRRIAEVIKQRKELLAENERLQGEAAQVRDLRTEVDFLRRIAEPVRFQQETFERRSVALRQATIGIAGGLLAAALVAAVVALAQGSSAAELAAIVASAMAVVGLVAAWLLAWRQRSRRGLVLRETTARAWSQVSSMRVAGSPTMHSLRTALLEITQDWPRAATAELAYILYDEFGTAPSDVARRRAEQVALRLGAPRDSVPSFSSWAGAVGLLDEDERLVLFDQLRRLLA